MHGDTDGTEHEKLLTVILLALSILGILGFGLHTKNFVLVNDAEWLTHPDALVFHGNGLAYTDTLSLPDSAAGTSGVTVFLLLDPVEEPGFPFIASMTNGDPGTQFVIAQWRNHLIVLSGDNYDDSERRPRLDTEITVENAQFDLLTIRLAPDAGELFLNGVLRSSTNAEIRLPATTDDVRLLIGDSLRLHNSWSGRIAGLALFPQWLPDADLTRVWQHWSEDRRFLPATPHAATVYYDFTEPRGNELKDLSGHGNRLLIPSYRLPLQPTFASLRLELSSLWDMTLNLIGFMPFGFLLARVVAYRWPINSAGMIALVLLCSALLSGAIELTQAWIPSRTSSLMDLLLNITGAICGSIVQLYVQRRFNPRTG